MCVVRRSSVEARPLDSSLALIAGLRRGHLFSRCGVHVQTGAIVVGLRSCSAPRARFARGAETAATRPAGSRLRTGYCRAWPAGGAVTNGLELAAEE